jgi:hypothetical protein
MPVAASAPEAATPPVALSAGTEPAAALAAGPPALPEPQAPDMLPGQVLARTPAGQSLIDTPAGALLLPAAADLPVGAGIQLKVMAPPQLPPAAPPVPTAGPGPHSWPALTEAITTLVHADPAAAQAMLSGLPQLTPALAANLSVFANALDSGDATAVLGPNTLQSLQRAGRRDLADRLKRDIADLGEDSGRPLGGGEWRAFTIPVINSGLVQPVRLVVRRAPSSADGGGTGPAATEHRFLLDLRMSRLGRIQMDGLVQRDTRRFDLIIRTATPLAPEMRRDIMGLFAACSDAVGTKGGVTFQGGGRFVDPPADGGGTTVTV